MTEILKGITNPKVNASGLVDVALLGISKSVTERITAPYIGNGTIKSGIIKLAAGGAGHAFLGENKIAGAITGGLVVDGIEDIVTAVLGGGASAAAATGAPSVSGARYSF